MKALKDTSNDTNTIDIRSITRELKIDARALGIPSGAANIFVKRSVNDALDAISGKSDATSRDFDRVLVRELKKYNPDLAYVYQNRDTII